MYTKQSVNPQMGGAEECSHGTQDSEYCFQVVDEFVAASVVVLDAKLTKEYTSGEEDNIPKEWGLDSVS